MTTAAAAFCGILAAYFYAVFGWCGRHVDGGVAIKESGGFHEKTDVAAWHDGKVLWPDHVMRIQRQPADDIGVFSGAALLYPRGQSIFDLRGALVGIIPHGVFFFFIKRCDPEMMIHVSCSLPDR